MLYVTIIFIITFQRTLSMQENYEPQIVNRLTEGDMFTIPNIRDCGTFNAVQNGTVIIRTRKYIWCKCPKDESTVFLKNNGPLCLAESGHPEIYHLPFQQSLQLYGYEESVPMLSFLNSTWQFKTNEPFLKSGGGHTFDYQSKCSKNITQFSTKENNGFGDWNVRPNPFKLKVFPNGKASIKLAPGTKMMQLDGRLFLLYFKCGASTFFLDVKFNGKVTYNGIVWPANQYDSKVTVSRDLLPSISDVYAINSSLHYCENDFTYMRYGENLPPCFGMKSLKRKSADNGHVLLIIHNQEAPVVLYEFDRKQGHWKMRSPGGSGRIFNANFERPMMHCTDVVVGRVELNEYEGWISRKEDSFLVNSTRSMGSYLRFLDSTADFKIYQGKLFKLSMYCLQNDRTYEMYIKFIGVVTYSDIPETNSPPWMTTSDQIQTDIPTVTKKPHPRRTTRRHNTQTWDTNRPHKTQTPQYTTHFPQTTGGNSRQRQSDKISTGTIVGSIIGGLVALVILVVVFYICYMKRREGEPRNKLQNEDSIYKRQGQQNPYITDDKPSTPWHGTASNALKIPQDPKRKEAEEAIILAMEIIQERQSKLIKPDVIPSYIKNRPVPQAQNADPRPKIGPLSKSGGYEEESQDLYVDPSTQSKDDDYSTLMKEDCQENFYLDLAQTNKQTQPIIEEQYLDLDQAKEDYMKSMTIEPDDTC